MRYRFPRILGGSVPVPSYVVNVFVVLVILVLMRAINAMRNDLFDDRSVGLVFVIEISIV